MAQHTKRRIVIGALSAAFVIAALPFAAGNMEKKVLDTTTRTEAPGDFIDLPRGAVHYAWSGPEMGQPVVLIHGFASWYFVWDFNVAPLADAGYRVLRYDLYGRGFSDRPHVRYTQDIFVDQLAELLDALHVEAPVHLAGLSLGAAIAVTFADKYPDRVGKLVLIGPAGYPTDLPAGIGVASAPLLGEWLLAVVGDRAIGWALPKNFHHRDIVASFTKKFDRPRDYEGYKRAMLSTYRNYPLFDLDPVYNRVGQGPIPTLLIWGRHDQIAIFTNNERVRKAIPHTFFHPIDDAGHMANYEAPDDVNPIILDFLKK